MEEFMEKRRRTEALCSAPVKRKAKRVLAVILAVLMLHSVVGYDGDITAYAQTGQTTYDIAMGALTINNSNLSNYNNTVITGSSGSNMITIDGVSVNLTLSNLNLNIESDTATTAGWNSAIKLTNGASLNLTVTGDNTVSAGMQHAAINVPAGCSLVITKESTGTLTATAGSGAAGIGADYGGIDFQTVGNITINGGTVKAYGMGAGAGIGGTAFGNTGNIMIHGGTVYAKGGGGVEINYGQLSAVCGAGIGGGDAGCVQNINITGGNVTAVGGHQHISVANFMDRPGAGIGCGSSTYASADGKYTCGTIAITGGVISATGGNNNAVNAIGYGLSPNVDTSGDNFIGCVTISENASVDINGGTIHPLTNSDKVNVYKLGMTIYDGRLTKTLEGASIKVNGKTYHSDIKVSENYVGNISYSFVRGIFTGEQTIEISAGDFSWNTTINFTNNKFDYTTVIGSKLYPVSLKFYDLNLTADKTDVSLMVKKDGKALNTNPSDGMIQLVCDGKISFMEEAVGKMTAYMPAGASTDITISGSGLNNSADITLKAQTVSESSSGTVLTAWENAKKYNLKFTIYDGKLTKGSYPATIAIGEKTVTKEITVNQNYIGTAALSQYLPLGSDTKDVQITTSSYTWKTTITPSGNGGDTAVVFGRKLYPVSLWFYDTAITSDINNVSLSVTQDGKTLNTVETEGMVQLVSDGTIIKQRDGIGKMTAYMPAGAETLLTAIAHGINGGKEITVSYKTIKASDNGTILVLWDKVQTVQLSEILDLSNGSITFADNGGKMDITYTPVNGGTAKTVTGQYYQNEYNIIQSDNTVTANQIIFQNTTDFVNINLNAVNMKSTGKAIDLQNAKAKLNLIGTNIIDCGGGGVDSGDASNYIGIRAAKGSELTIDGNGSLEVKNPSYYGVGIGGYYHYTNKIYEGAGIIRIQGGTLKVSGKKNGAAIGSCYQYTGADFGSIYISGGVVDAISVSGAVIGGSADAKPANV
ncbi:MAG: hypothetical protein PWP24_857, partial [Clostridiales bacterium]|nr:hypothetical protein [Clostridiales bacterium]